jgi:hypothetical protein
VHVLQRIGIDVAHDEIVIIGVLQTEKFRREARDIAVAIHVEHAEGFHLRIFHHALIGAKYSRQHPIDR